MRLLVISRHVTDPEGGNVPDLDRVLRGTGATSREADPEVWGFKEPRGTLHEVECSEEAYRKILDDPAHGPGSVLWGGPVAEENDGGTG
jgi:hypothetical protein